MADFETKLRRLSERGNPVGPEELIERIEADMAGDPLVVVAKRREGTIMTKTQQRPTTRQPSRNWGPVWGVAVFVAILAVAGLYFASADDSAEVADNPPTATAAPDVETMTDLQIIEAGVAALYSGDAERAVQLFGIEDGDDERQASDDDLIRQEAAYQAAIGGRLTLNCTEGPGLLPIYPHEVNGPGMFTCDVPYHNALTDAVGYVDSPGDLIRVVVKDGVITQFGYPGRIGQGIPHEFPEHNDLLRHGVDFLRKEVEAPKSCWGGDIWSNVAGVRTPECVRLIMDDLDGFAAYYKANS